MIPFAFQSLCVGRAPTRHLHTKLTMFLFILRTQFWIMYYRFLSKGDSCLGKTKKLEMANIKEMQSLYCSGLDLERPLLSSLSPCSDMHRNKVQQCINEFAATFTLRDGTQDSLCGYDIPFLFCGFRPI